MEEGVGKEGVKEGGRKGRECVHSEARRRRRRRDRKAVREEGNERRGGGEEEEDHRYIYGFQET